MIGRILSPVRKWRNEKNIKRLKSSIVNSHHDVSQYANGRKVADMRAFGFSLSESATYDLIHNDYREYINTWEAYQPRVKNSRNFLISDDKFIFSLVMGNVVEVSKILAVIDKGVICEFASSGFSNDNLYELIIRENGVVIKDRDGYDGFAIYVFDVQDNRLFYKDEQVDKQSLAEIVSKIENGIIQTKLTQGAFENAIFNKSINTVRMITMKKKDRNEHEIVAALQRIGTMRIAPVDNFNQGGGSALIDIDTGILGSMTCIDSFDENGERIFYDKHPDTNVQIKGTIIPNWNNIKEEIINITRQLPLWDYVAWDIVVKDDGIAIIETNMKSSLNLLQVHGGMRNKYLGQKYLEHGYLVDEK